MNLNEKVNADDNLEAGDQNVKTYLETYDQSLPKNITQKSDVANFKLSNVGKMNGQWNTKDSTRHNGALVEMTHTIFDDFNYNKSLNGDKNSSASNASDLNVTSSGHTDSPVHLAISSSQEKTATKRSTSPDYQDVEEVDDSRQDLKDFYKQCKAERLQEQEMAEKEKLRLEEILKICSEFEVQSSDNTLNTRSESRNSLGKIKTNGSLTKLVLSLNEASSQNIIEHRVNHSSSSNSDDDIEKATIKRRPSGLTLTPNCTVTPSQTKQNPLSPSLVNADISPISGSSYNQNGRYMYHNFTEVPDVLIDSDWSSLEESLKLEDLSNSFQMNSSLNNSERKSIRKGSAPNFSSISYSSDPKKTQKFDVSKQWRNQMQNIDADRDMDALAAQQSDVIQAISDIKQKIVNIEGQQSQALSELELERSLLEGEQQTQMEQLRLAEEKINELERKESLLLSEAMQQRAKELELIEKERERLKDMKHLHGESQHVASMSVVSSMSQSILCDEQDAIENQHYIVDNLEFQQLETESRFEEEKEIIQKQLKLEREDLLNLCLQHQTTLDQIGAQQSDLLQHVDMEVYQLENERQQLVEQFKAENTTLLKINNKSRELSLRLLANQHGLTTKDDSNSLALLESINNLELTSRDLSKTVSRLDSRHRSLHNIELWDGIYEINDNERQRMNEIRLRTTLPPRSPWDSRRQRSEGRDVRRDHGHVLNDSWSHFRSESEDESSASGSERLSDTSTWKDDELDKLADMECLLVLKNADKLRQLEEQGKWQATMTGSPEKKDKRSNDSDCHGAINVADYNDCGLQDIKRREKEKLQSRPLTRYLPVRDQTLDLAQFIISSGHSIQHCCHLLMSSTCCRGYLMKMGSRIRSWKKRWFVFDRSRRCLSYYVDKCESKARGVIYFQAIEDVFVDHMHQVKSPTPQLTFCVKTYDRMYYLVAPSPDSMRIWIDVLFTGAEGYHQFA